MRTLLACVAVAIGALLSVRPMAAQEGVNYGSVSGRVLDSNGGALAGADVEAVQASTNVRSRMATDADGRYRFPYLRPGQYVLTARAKGFAPVKKSLTLTVGTAFDVPFVLNPGAEETVTVTADVPVVDTARTQIAGTVAQKEIEALPMKGRNFLDLALLIPGVSPTNVGGGTQLFPETSAVPGVGLSINSQRNLSNNFMVDGLSANDDAAALSGISFSADAIDQFQVVTSGGQAELGRALGGYVNIATRSGTNVWQSTIYSYFRDDSLNGKNALSGARLPMDQQQFGGSLGGPIARDRTFFFFNIERNALDQSGLVTIGEGTVSAINARLAAVGYAGPAVTTGIYDNPIDAFHVLSKVDHHLANGSLMSVRYSSYDVRSQNARGAGGTSAPSASAGLDNLDQAVAVTGVAPLSPTTILEIRGQVARGDLEAPPTDLIGPAVNISGIATFGRLSSSPTGRLGMLYQGVASVVRQAGPHALRAGVDVLHNDVTITFPRSVAGSYTFASLPAFLAGTYNNSGFTQTFGDSAVNLNNPNVGVYLQDEWRVRSNLTINAGVRYDLQYLPTIQTDTNNVSPRFGLAWSPTASKRTVVRLTTGRFYDRVPLRALANALLSAGNTTDLGLLRQINVSLSPTQSGAPAFPATLASVVPTTTLVNLTTMDPALQNAYSNQFALEVEHQIWNGSVSASYQRVRGFGLLMQINQNVPTCAASGNNNGCRPNPAYANNNQYSAEGHSEYDGLHLSLVQRAADWGMVRVSYTYSKSMNNIGEAFFSSPVDPTDLSKDWGRSDDDQRHRLVVSGSTGIPVDGASWWARLARGFQFSGMVQHYSALPYNITTGTTTIQGTTARPTVNGVMIERNAGEGAPFSTVSLRALFTIPLHSRGSIDLMVEAFNLLDQRNDVARNTVFGTGAYPTNPAPTYGQITVVGDPRTVQFGLRFRY